MPRQYSSAMLQDDSDHVFRTCLATDERNGLIFRVLVSERFYRATAITIGDTPIAVAFNEGITPTSFFTPDAFAEAYLDRMMRSLSGFKG